MSFGYRLWPCYETIRKAKIHLHPEYSVNDEGTIAVVGLQAMANHTVGRILLDDNVWEAVTRDSFLQEEGLVLTFYIKIGQDGTSFYPMLKTGSYIGQDRFWMGTWFCCLQLVGLFNGQERPYYTNNLALSAESCRPLRLANERETPAINKAEFDRIKTEIQGLQPWKFSNRVTVNFRIWNSMNDTKEVNDMVDVSGATKCPVCSKCHSQWIHCYDSNGDFDETLHEPIPLNEAVFEELAASITHFGINAFKHLYNLSLRMHLSHRNGYNIDWAVERDLVNARKTCLQDRFNEILLLDFMTNTGSTMTGNAARTAFNHPDFTAENFEVHIDIVKGLRNVWIALRAPFKIDPDLFKAYCRRLRKRYYELYSWGELNVTIHKILDHGHLFLPYVPDTLTLAWFSEENLEASHKVLRDHLINHARQFFRKDRLKDVIQRKLDMSDPVILAPAMEKHPAYGNSKVFPDEVMDMAYVPEVAASGDRMDTT